MRNLRVVWKFWLNYERKCFKKRKQVALGDLVKCPQSPRLQEGWKTNQKGLL